MTDRDTGIEVPINRFMIGMQGDMIVFLLPVPQKLSGEDAINLAAWLLAMSPLDEPREAFEKAVSAITGL